MKQEVDSGDKMMQSEMSSLQFLNRKMMIVEKWWQKRKNEWYEEA